MATVRVDPALSSSLRYAYPIELTLQDGSNLRLQRYYSDFANLQASLVAANVKRIPDIPEKKWDGRSRVRERRRAAFQYFLQWCISNIPDNQCVLDFFGIDSFASLKPLVSSLDIPQNLPPKKLQKMVILSTPEQNLLKILIFFLIWITAWRSMVDNLPSDVAAEVLTVDTHPVLAEATTSALSTELDVVTCPKSNEQATVHNITKVAIMPASTKTQELTSQNVEPELEESERATVDPQVFDVKSHQPTRQHVDFFLSPFHGVIAFAILYVVALVYSNYYYSAPLAKEHDEQVALSPIPYVTPERSKVRSVQQQQVPTQPSPKATLTFDGARELFQKYVERTARDKQEKNRALAYLLRSTGENPENSTYPNVRLLQKFWEEASALSPEVAQDKFIELVSVMMEDNSQVVDEDFGSDEDVSVNASFDSTSSASALRDYNCDTTSPLLTELQLEDQAVNAIDNIRLSLLQGSDTKAFLSKCGDDSQMTSFDSTDISVLSMSPSREKVDYTQQRTESKATAVTQEHTTSEATPTRTVRDEESKVCPRPEVATGIIERNQADIEPNNQLVPYQVIAGAAIGAALTALVWRRARRLV